MKISDPQKLKSKEIRNIIFDWGGVITNLDFNFVKKSFENIGVQDFTQLFSKAYQNKFLTDFETNNISPKQFRSEIRKLTDMNPSDSEIDEAWNSVLGETPNSRIKLLKNLRKNYRLFLLSNTNSIHVNYYNHKLRDEVRTDHSMLFEKAYYSHEVGIRKPDVRIFEFVLNEQCLLPEETLFIDDTEIHVDAAVSAGMNAFYLDIEKFDVANIFKAW